MENSVQLKKYLHRITTRRPFTEKNIEIDVGGLNLIITGTNGSGKTSLVKELYNKVYSLVVERKQDRQGEMQRNLSYWKNQLSANAEHTHQYKVALQQIQAQEKELLFLSELPSIEFAAESEFAADITKGIGVVEFFEAHRRSDIAEARVASSLEHDRSELSNVDASNRIGSKLESHLVNLHTRRIFAKNENNDLARYEAISAWFENFTQNLKFLLEDETSEMEFDADKFRFYICQEGKSKYTFQNLSSGYSSIFSVLSRLLMRAEYLKVPPLILSGVVIIDELDAHLHVSLQKKILPFLSRAFPRIQFVVTTHSPFVLSSVSDAVIYDLGRDEQVTDLSSYSYESIVEAVFGVTNSSELLEGNIAEIAELLNSNEVDLDRLRFLTKSLLPSISHMDEEARFYIQRALYLIQKENKAGK